MTAFYLQHGHGTQGPFRTERVEHRESPMAHHRLGLQYKATGYGKRIPTVYMVRYNGRWHRVYCAIFSNIGTLYIRTKDGDITAQESQLTCSAPICS